jgi:putative heme iron utilization protein
MSKVLTFPKNETQDGFVDSTAVHMRKAVRIAIAMEMPNGQIWTGYWNCSGIDKQTMVSHIQIDIIQQCMEATYDLYPIED